MSKSVRLVRAIVSMIGLLCCGMPLAAVCLPAEQLETMKVRLTLQENQQAFEYVSVNTNSATASFVDVDLSKSLTTIDDGLYYAFRFTTPQDAGRLVWSFKQPSGLLCWYIHPAKGRMQGFSYFETFGLGRDDPELGRMGTPFIVQGLPSAYLEPKKDYIMYFLMKENAKPNITLSLNILPKAATCHNGTIFPLLYDASGRGNFVIERKRTRGGKREKSDEEAPSVEKKAKEAPGEETKRKTREELLAEGYREWHGKNGETLFAKYFGTHNGMVRLIDANGARMSTFLDRFSEADQAYIATLEKKDTASAEVERKMHQELLKQGYREWRGRSGRTVFGKYNGVANGMVRLIGDDGSKMAVLLEQLSDADQAYIASLNK